MKIKLRLVSAILILSMIFPLFSGIIQPVLAAEIIQSKDINVTYDKNAKTAKISWKPVQGVTTGTITYHDGVDHIVTLDATDIANNSKTITNIKNDIIYDFLLALTDGTISYEGTKYLLAQVTVEAKQVDQQPVTVAGGGVESGIYPALKFSWSMPKIFDSSDNTMKYATKESGLLAQIGSGNIEGMNFSFNIKKTSTQSLAYINVDYDFASNTYKAAAQGSPNKSDVKSDGNGANSFYILGVKDKDTPIPSMADIHNGTYTLPIGIPSGDENYVLPHQEILPGSVYWISMNTVYFDSSNKFIEDDAIDTEESRLKDNMDYTYTPIRFQLTKDSKDYVYVGIHRVNAGDINLPSLYYYIQTSDQPYSDDKKWTDIRKLSNSSFPADAKYVITPIDGINPKNLMYYRIVVKSDSAEDRIQSLNLPYRMQDDNARPPVPNNVSISKVDLVAPPAGIPDTSSDVTIQWDKPANWDQITDKTHPENDVYYHFLINVDEKDLDIDHVISPDPILEADGKSYGRYDANYRMVKYVSANSADIKQSADGSKLIYTLKGYKLFTDEAGIYVPDLNKDNYPTYLLPNKTYYLQMYTTLAADKGKPYNTNMSEKSLVTSFTTLSPTSRDVPTPKHLEWVKTTINPSTATKPADAAVQIRFEDLNPIVWKDYTIDPNSKNELIYDLYMSTNGASNFQPIGTTDSKKDQASADVKFLIQTLGTTTWVSPTINKFKEPTNVQNFGNSLAPNSTYYFMVKVRLRMEDELGKVTEKSSIGTELLSVTTNRGEATTPDNLSNKPLAPTDFAIALDNNGDQMVSGHSVTFEWTAQEASAAYNLIATTGKVAPDTSTTDSSITLDPTYMSYISNFGNMDNDFNKDKLLLDPNDKTLPANFTYDSTTKKCRYTINTWIFPNKIYYFSLRAEIAGIANPSLWVSIPVTTALIESPTQLQVVNDCELAFAWIDNTANMTAENYSISIKASGDSEYTALTKAQYTIVKNGDNYYGRTTSAAKLKADTQYSIKVARTGTDGKHEFDPITKSTRNDYYQIDVKWQAPAIDAYSGFELAVKTEDDSDYTVLNNSIDLEQFEDISTHTYSYYKEKNNSNQGNNYYIYNARIKYAPVKLSDGTTEHRPLKPNTKYYIKVRAVKKDALDQLVVTQSKYAGPVDTRTEFSQNDYDDKDHDTSISEKFIDMMEKLEEEVFWEVNKGNGKTNKIYIKDDKVVNLLEHAGNFYCAIDISQSPDYITTDEIYLAKNILQAMKSNNKSLTVIEKGVQYTIRPETFDIENMEEFKNAKAVTGSKDVYLKLIDAHDAVVQPSAPANTTPASKMNVLSAQAVVSKQTSDSIRALIKDKLYNEKTGIIQKKIAIIKNPNNPNLKGDTKSNAEDKAENINKYLNQLFEEVKSEVSFYIEDTLDGTGYSSGVLGDQFNISKFSSPMGVKMSYNANSISNPYVLYGNVGNWQKLTKNLKYDKGYLSYFVTGTGKYTVLSAKDIAASVPDDSPAKPYISKLAASYDLTTVFPGADAYFNPDLSVTVKEGILLYELLLESRNDAQTDIKAKAKAYGIDKIINVTNIYRNLTRQEAASIVIKLYCQKTGADYDKLKTSYSKLIKDDSKIDEKYAVPVYECLQMSIMTLDSSEKFNPKAVINRAELATVIQKMLEL